MKSFANPAVFREEGRRGPGVDVGFNAAGESPQ